MSAFGAGSLAALLWPALLYVSVLVLHLVLPARLVEGYVRDRDGHALGYRLNGALVFLVSVGVWAIACERGLFAWDALYVHRFESLLGACAVGLGFTLFVVFREPPVQNWSTLKQLYLGRAEQPQWLSGRADAKMFLYLAGAVALELNLLSFAAHHLSLHRDDPSPGVLLHVALFSFFLVDYLVFERVHLYTYDFVAERVGFKLGWGCLVFYPYFYAVGLWALAEAPNPHSSFSLLAVSGILFASGWAISRGANLQKFWFKVDPSKKAFGVIEPLSLTSGDGRRVLVSGFWGLSRHINYLGEMLMACGLVLSLGYPRSPWPWLYVLYYVALLVPRQLDDDRRCREKYGKAWSEYVRRVPYRIVPGIY